MRTELTLLLLLPLATGCFSFEERERVRDRRILALRAEPPELIADGSPLPASVDLSALVVDPSTGTAVEVPYEWRSCSALGIATSAGAAGGGGPGGGPPGGFGSRAEPDGRCPETDASNLAEAGTLPLDQWFDRAWSLPVPEQAGVAVAGAAQQGVALPFYLVAQLRLDSARGLLYAQKRVVVSAPLPAGRKANENPRLAALYIDGKPWSPDAPRTLKLHGCATGEKAEAVDPNDEKRTWMTCDHTITPVYDAAESEGYEVQRFDGGVEKMRERLRFDWYVDGGSLDQSQTEEPSQLSSAKRDPLSTKWREPETASGPLTLWVVVRDGRGGTTWARRQLALEP
ncbi:MAG: hypothetical protein RL199_1588 [Pseudomonadota bacterium]|jgi:hypothetical protein